MNYLKIPILAFSPNNKNKNRCEQNVDMKQ